jgi:TetR/AcrR family transcriptional regulator
LLARWRYEKDTLTKLIETATPLIADKACGVSVRELSHAAAPTRRRLLPFRRQKRVYHAVLEYQFEPIAAALERIQAISSLPPVERLELYASLVTGVHRQRPYLLRFVHSELTCPTTAFEAVVKKYIPRIFHFLHQSLEDGVAAGDFRPDLDTNFACLSLAGILNFYFIVKPLARQILPIGEFADEKYVSQAFAIYINGIRRNEHE